MDNPVLSVTVTNENGFQLKFRIKLIDLLSTNPDLRAPEFLEELANTGEAWLQSGAIAKVVDR